MHHYNQECRQEFGSLPPGYTVDTPDRFEHPDVQRLAAAFATVRRCKLTLA